MYGPIILYVHTKVNGVSTPFRCAFLIDKDDPVVNEKDILLYSQFCAPLFLNSELSGQLAESLAWNIP